MSCERKMTHLLLLLGRNGVGQMDSWWGCQKPLDGISGMCGMAFALWSRWGEHSRGANACFFSVGGISLGPDAQKGRAWSPVPAPRCCLLLSHGIWGWGHWQVASSDFPSKKLFLESVGCEPQSGILLSWFSQELSPFWHGTAWGKDIQVWLQGFGLVLISSHHP